MEDISFLSMKKVRIPNPKVISDPIPIDMRTLKFCFTALCGLSQSSKGRLMSTASPVSKRGTDPAIPSNAEVSIPAAFTGI